MCGVRPPTPRRRAHHHLGPRPRFAVMLSTSPRSRWHWNHPAMEGDNPGTKREPAGVEGREAKELVTFATQLTPWPRTLSSALEAIETHAILLRACVEGLLPYYIYHSMAGPTPALDTRDKRKTKHTSKNMNASQAAMRIVLDT